MSTPAPATLRSAGAPRELDGMLLLPAGDAGSCLRGEALAVDGGCPAR